MDSSSGATTGTGTIALFAAASIGLLGRIKWQKQKFKKSTDKHIEAFERCTTKDWKYIAEGALNVALRYVGKDENLVGFVLRVRKRNEKATGGKVDSDPWHESLAFVEKMIVPLLGRRYVQRALQVKLKAGFMKQLGEEIEDDRPVKRRKYPLDVELKTGLLMVDNTSIPVGNGPSICFELKLKCGFIPKDCPFVTHPVKKENDRFTMHQQFKNLKGKLDTLSRYSPFELFSYDKQRVLGALNALVETPQNNFRMFVDGAMLYPDSEGHGSREKFEQVLQKFPEIRGGVDGLLDTLAEMFVREPLLDRVRSIQQMDDIDIEGVWPIYQEIVKRGESIQPLADGDTLYPRVAPKTLPSAPSEQHEAVRRFMLSKTAKDCSTMIVMKPSSSASSLTSKLPNFRRVPITLKSPRIIVEDFHGYSYSISVVDLDPKPIEKLQHYYELDKEIAETFASLKSQNKLL